MRPFMLILLATAILTTTANAQSPTPQSPTSAATAGKGHSTQNQSVETTEQTEDFWMRQKLEYSKAILQSLTSGEFDKLATEAEKMRRLSKIEGFVRRRNQAYREQLEAFNRANGALVLAAEKADATGSLRAFHQLTSSCVACHQLLRNERE